MVEETFIDVQRHASQEVPSAPIPAPKTGGTFEVDSNVVKGKYSQYPARPDERIMLKANSFTYPGDHNNHCTKLWNVSLGSHGKNDLFSSGW